MKKVEISLFSFNELNDEAKKQAVLDHSQFLIDTYNQEEEGVSRKEYLRGITIDVTIDNILANDYLFFFDGTLANVTHYVGSHPRAGEVELKLGGQTYIIEKPAPVMTTNFDDIIKKHNLKTFHSSYSEEDTELPYVFDLNWDIKSVGELHYNLKNSCFDNPAADIEETMFEHGLTVDNLTNYYKVYKPQYSARIMLSLPNTTKLSSVKTLLKNNSKMG